MDSSKLTRRIGFMAFSVIAAVATLRFSVLLSEEASSFYLLSMVSTFEEVIGIQNWLSSIVWIVVSLGLGVMIKRNFYHAFAAITTVALLFIVGAWLTTFTYPTFGYDSQSLWILVIIGINLLIATLASAIPLALVGVFITQVLRPV